MMTKSCRSPHHHDIITVTIMITTRAVLVKIIECQDDILKKTIREERQTGADDIMMLEDFGFKEKKGKIWVPCETKLPDWYHIASTQLFSCESGVLISLPVFIYHLQHEFFTRGDKNAKHDRIIKNVNLTSV